ncbi:MAG: twin-arginine translocase TatA/TatE family subunit [Planctomycetota bacterium]
MTYTAPFLTPAIFNLGPPELIAIALVMLLLFGSRLPSVMRNLGRGVTEFKKGIRSTDDDDTKTIDPPANPPTQHTDTTAPTDSSGEKRYKDEK